MRLDWCAVFCASLLCVGIVQATSKGVPTTQSPDNDRAVNLGHLQKCIFPGPGLSLHTGDASDASSRQSDQYQDASSKDGLKNDEDLLHVDDAGYFKTYYGRSGDRRYREGMMRFLAGEDLSLEALTYAQAATRALSKMKQGTPRHAKAAARAADFEKRIEKYLAARKLSADDFRRKAMAERRMRIKEARKQGELPLQDPERREYLRLCHLRRKAARYLRAKLSIDGSVNGIDAAKLRSLSHTLDRTSHLNSIRGKGAQKHLADQQAFFRGEAGLTSSVLKHIKFLRGRVEYGLAQGQDMSRMQVTLQEWQNKVDDWLAKHGDDAPPII